MSCVLRLSRVLLGCLALAFVYGQVDTGTILGTVRDNTGAVIPGATVTIRNEGTALLQTTKTSSEGTYVFRAQKIGQYSIGVTNAGFKKERRTGLVLNIQQQLVVEFN